MLENIFYVSATIDQNYRKPHYPRYKTRDLQIGVATSLESALTIIKANVGNEYALANVHHFTVREVLADETYLWWEYETFRIYDANGDLIDQTLSNYRTDTCGPFHGRKDDEIRFKPGDIVEVFGRDEISLAFVASVPPSEDQANRCELDSTDDCYVVLTNEDYRYHNHVSSMRLFKPQHKINPAIEAKLRNAYRDSKTFEKRQEIAMTTAVAQLHNIAEEIGAESSIKTSYYDYLYLTLKGVTRLGKDVRIRINSDKAFHHMDRVRITMYRLWGISINGRGYGLKKAKEGLEYDYTI